MNENYPMEATQAYESQAKMTGNILRGPQYNPTIRENLDNRIKEHQKCIEELERTKAAMPDNLIDMKISDLRQAMNY